MEKIKLAVEKARASRENLSGAGGPVYDQPFTPQVAQHNPGFPAFELRQVELDIDHLEDNRIISHERSNPKAASFDMLRTQVIQRMGDAGWQTLAITSPKAGCGKTVTAINLAFSVARHTDRSAILIDLDLRKPNVGNYLGIACEKSLIDYIQGTALLEEILVSPGVDRLGVLVNNGAIKNASEVITSKILNDMVLEIRHRFPTAILIFDLPPMLSTDDVLAFLPQVDCTLLIVASGQTVVSEVENCERLMNSTNYLGIVLNKHDGAQEEYY
jgi:protein-tyrosine kinase